MSIFLNNNGLQKINSLTHNILQLTHIKRTAVHPLLLPALFVLNLEKLLKI